MLSLQRIIYFMFKKVIKMGIKLTKNSKIRAKTIFILALHAVLEMSSNTMLGVADTLIISRIMGKEGLAAVGFTNTIFLQLFLYFLLSMLVLQQ